MTLTIWKAIGLVIVSIISAIAFAFIATGLIGLALPVGEETYAAYLIMGFLIPSICILAGIHTKVHQNKADNKEQAGNDSENPDL